MSSKCFSALTVALLGLGANGCTVGPDFNHAVAPAASTYVSASDAVRLAAGAPIGDPAASASLRWWEAFGSPQLDALVDRAMANNASLAASNATLARARDQIVVYAGRKLPQVDLTARVEREQANLAAFGFDPSAVPGLSGTPRFSLYTVGGGVSYDLDLFGANRRRVEQARAEAEAQLRQAEAAHLTIAGRVVNQVLTIAAIRARIATTQALLGEDQRLVDLTEKRRKAGEGTLVEVLNVQSQLANDQGDVPQLYQDLDAARHMLATLIGVAPSDLGPTDFDLGSFTLPHAIPVAIPSELVRKRPDILQAEADLHAATAAIGVATAHLYPNVTLGITSMTETPALGKLFTGGSGAYDLFAGLSAPIFHGGTLKAQRQAAVDAATASAATYRQTVLDAFRQVADLLQALQADQASVTTRSGAGATAARSRDLSRRSFQVGNSAILSVLDTERLYQRAQLELVDARARQMLNVARLYVATAGGWTGPAIASR